MVSIPAGSFSNGTSTVTLSAFRMAQYDVTQSQYQAITGNNPSNFSGNSDASTCPVENVSWYDAVEFCNSLSTTAGLQPVYAISGRTPATGYPIIGATVMPDFTKSGYRLPTEAQWEYAARAGTTTTYYWGNASDTATVRQYAWFESNSRTTHAVGQKLPNSWGLYDMAGDVWQWCWDWYGTYPSGPQTDPTGSASGLARAMRGGSWGNTSECLTSAFRYEFNPSYQYNIFGFRVCAP
jgi:formylglycine-generating enzyme required for sulfatase activity